jgi:hypothetical protein
MDEMDLLPYPEHEPPFPGWAFSLCCHGPPSRAYRDCEICMEALANYQDRRSAWMWLTFYLWILDWIFRLPPPKEPSNGKP